MEFVRAQDKSCATRKDSFIAEGEHGTDPGGAKSRNIGGDKSDEEQKGGEGWERQEVRRRHAVKNLSQAAEEEECERHPQIGMTPKTPMEARTMFGRFTMP